MGHNVPLLQAMTYIKWREKQALVDCCLTVAPYAAETQPPPQTTWYETLQQTQTCRSNKNRVQSIAGSQGYQL